MSSNFEATDWLIVVFYLLLLATFGWWSNRSNPEDTRDYFLGGNSMSLWVVAFSVLATTQSAATFLGGPDHGYRSNFTYVTASGIGGVVAAILVAKLFVPHFYALRVTTVYEFLGVRFGKPSMQSAGAVYLIGRLFASGSRLYLAAIAISMILFSNIHPSNIIVSAFLMMAVSFLITVFGGIRSVIWSDLIQFLIYTVSALTVLYFLFNLIPLTAPQMLDALKHAPGEMDKLRFLDFSLDTSKPFNLLSIFTGMILLYIGNFGMDQDTTQRLLTCKDHHQGGNALIISSIVTVPVVFLFVMIGVLLHLFYDRADLILSTGGELTQSFQGEKITVFMHFILNNMPSGLKGLVVVGVIAASISTINSSLNSMSSVIVQDFYRPWREKSNALDEKHYVLAGRISMGIVGVGMFLMSTLCLYWQRYTDMPLLEFALSVMIFAYSGLLGIFFTAALTNRGSTKSVTAALIIGFVVSALQQSYIVDSLGLPTALKETAFTWKLCISTLCAFLVAISGQQESRVDHKANRT